MYMELLSPWNYETPNAPLPGSPPVSLPKSFSEPCSAHVILVVHGDELEKAGDISFPEVTQDRSTLVLLKQCEPSFGDVCLTLDTQ